ncbi:MAG: hypothetical protein KIT11_04340 [Fimbriimonadaceae bacterium]|nr:hypothetical protein [Fimbriimonadaceae bacterium]QYK56875.1 MAG: hypothetical protein KF733_05185 [Fimbriimonadaceae bacterium]
MVDARLPFEFKDERPLRALFLDLNAYFASVEQAERPELRGRPVIVVPLMADTTFAIAASYEAKRFGIKTGTRVGEAKLLCPDLVLVEARPPLYVHYHHRVLEVCEDVLPIEKVCSIDEMRFQLIGKERQPEEAKAIARRLKKAIRERVAENMSCSIGIAPNGFLAKLATEFEKPDGLATIQSHELPDRLKGLKLTTFPGINTRTEARLKGAGIFTSDDMLARSPAQLRRAFGSVGGERWYYLLRGYQLDRENATNKSLGHSNVLAPELRTDQGCRDVLLRLAHKASARLRKNGLWAQRISIGVSGKRSWHAEGPLPPTQDSVTVTERLLELWEGRDFEGPIKVGVTFTHLAEPTGFTPSLFDDTIARAEMSRAVDRINQKFGKNSVYLASIEKAKDRASEKIAFNKTWLFSEGKGDNEWPDTFRGHRDD